MSEYMFQKTKPYQIPLKSKEERAKLLAQVRQRRRVIYHNFHQRLSRIAQRQEKQFLIY